MIRRKASVCVMKAVVLGVMCACLAPAQAHHASANFDSSKTYSFRATVKKWLWANPHSWLYAVVTKSNGSQELWGFEAGGTNMLIRSGWSAADPKPGDNITVYAERDRTGIHIGELSKVVLANGQSRSLGPPLTAASASPSPGGAGAAPLVAPGAPPSGAPVIPYN